MNKHYFWARAPRVTLAAMLAFSLLSSWFVFPTETRAATVTLYPTANGTYTAWQNDWDEVNETTNFSCSSGDYIRDNDINNQNESFLVSLASIPNGSTITSVEVKMYARDDDDDDDDGGNFRALVRLNGVDSLSTGSPVSPSNENCTLFTRTIDVADTVKGAGTTLEIGVSKQNEAGKVRVGAIHAVVTYTEADTTPPTVTINQKVSQSDPTSSAPIKFTVVFSEPVTGFDASDVLLSGTAGLTATVSSVTGSLSEYEVNVTGMTVSGKVIATIPANAAEDAAGNDSGASSSTDNEVTYNKPNTAPVANNVNTSTDEDTPVGVTLSASDSDSDPLTWAIVIGPSHGTLSVSSGNYGAGPHFTYTPDSNYHGSDDFTYRVNDGQADSNTAEIDIDINSVPEVCPQGSILVYGDNGEYCQEVVTQCVVVSNTEDFYVEGNTNAVATWVHDAWADALSPMATWIWGDVEVEDPSEDETQTFTKTFYLDQVPSSAVLELAADNGALVKVNGNTVLDHLSTLDDSDQNYNDPVDSIDITSEVQAGENIIEVTVTNLGYATQDSHVNPAGFIYRITAEDTLCGEPKEVVENSCIVPGEDGPTVDIGTSAEKTLQEILNDEGYSIDVDTDQKNYQAWSDSGDTIHFTVEVLDKIAGHSHVFGYFVNGGAFVPVFKSGASVGPNPAYLTIPTKAPGQSVSFTANNVNDIEFAIADWNASTETMYSTDLSDNPNGQVHALVYNPNNDEYVIAFEDLAISSPSDEDYNDLVVKLLVTGCEDGAQCEPGVELFENGDFEDTPALGGSKWNIFASDTIGWLAEWLAPAGAPEIANLEIQEEGLNGWLASDSAPGTQWTELDSDWQGPGGGSGEKGAVHIYQSIPTVPGETYTVSFEFSPRPGTSAAQNKVEVLANGDVIGTVSASDPVSPTLTAWTPHTFSFEADSYLTMVGFRDAGGTPNDSLGTFIDNASVMCEEPEPTATLVATKIVCTDESELPNWGTGNGQNITASTAQDWVDTHESCYLAPDWQFEWVTDEDSNTNPGDNILSPASSPWYLFGPTAGDGTITTQIPAGGKVWVREVLKEGFIPFTYNLGESQSNENDFSAEIYCSTDVLNYDNWDWIDPVEAGETYYCVAWNHPTEDQCNPEAEQVLLSSDNDGEQLYTEDEAGFASLVSDPNNEWTDDLLPALWIWKDSATSNADAADGTVETFTRTFEIIGTPQDSTLRLAADNQVLVEVNGNELVNDTDENNYGSVSEYVVPASMLVNGENEITFTITNIDHETANDPSNNPGGLVYELVVNENECEVPPEPFASVTMCKMDTQYAYLPNWTLMLQGEYLENLVIPVNSAAGIDSVSSLEDGVSYLAIASGLWRNSVQGANWVDAEYSTTDGWSTPIDGFVGYSTDILELQINEEFDPQNNWGPYNGSHTYAQSFIQSSNGSANFRIYDGDPIPTVQPGWYTDNVESSLQVDLYEGYAGVTGDGGCVTIQNVPYGTYTFAELMKDGWSQYAVWDGDEVIDGTTVVVNEQQEQFTMQNMSSYNDDEEDTGTLVIVKETGEDDGTFTFQIGGNDYLENLNVSTTEGTGSDSIELEPGLYSVLENVPEGWSLENVTCEYESESEGSEIQNGYQVYIYEDETVTCTFTNEKTEEDSGPEVLSRGSGPNHQMGQDDGDGEVLGEQVEACGPLLTTFMRMGIQNNEGEVLKLQNFLNGEMGSGLPLTGFFGPLTDAAVHAFQLKYWEEVLQPWFNIEGSAILDQDDSTGYVYKTTQRMVNNIFCPSLNLPIPPLP